MVGRVQQVRWSDFRAGWDTREGTFIDGNSPLRFREMENVITGTDRRMRRRWPVKELDAQCDQSLHGLFLVDGRLTTIGLVGGSNNISGPDAGMIDVLEADVPPLVGTTSFEVLALEVVDNIPCAAIRHRRSIGVVNGVDIDSEVWLHVWDQDWQEGREPTWVGDPYVPSNFAQGRAAGTIGGTAAAFIDNAYDPLFTPRMAAVGSRLAMSRSDGRTALSKLGNPRSWNPWTQSDIEENGDIVAWLKSNGSDTVILPMFKHTDFVWDGATRSSHRFYSYLLEYLDADGAWVPFVELRGPDAVPGDGFYKISSDPNGNLQLNIFDAGGTWAYNLVRFRAIRRNHFIGTLGASEEDLNGFVAGNWDHYWPETKDTPNSITLWANPLTWPRAPEYSDKHLAIRTPNDSTTYTMVIKTRTPQKIDVVIGDIELEGIDWAVPYTYQATGYVGSGASNKTAHVYVCGGPTSAYQYSVSAYPAEWLIGLERHYWWLFPYTFRSDGTDTSVEGNPWLQRDASWHDERFFHEIRKAGAASTAAVGSASGTQGHGPVLCLRAMRNVLFVQYENVTQTWLMPADANQIEHIDTSPFGCGTEGYPEATVFDAGLIMSPTVNGWRAWDVGGRQVISLQDKNVGEAIDLSQIGPFTARGAAYWPHQGCYVSLGEHDGDYAGVVFRFSRENSIAAWHRIKFTADHLPQWRNDNATPFASGLWRVQRSLLLPVQDRLYWRHDNVVKYFDAAETASLIDANESAGNGFTERLVWHHMRLNADYLKRLQYIEVDQNGEVDIEVNIVPDVAGEVLPGPTITGMTYNHRKVRLPYQFYALAMTLTSQTETLHRINEIAICYNNLRRLIGG